MSAAEFRDHMDVEVEETPTTEPLGLAPDAVEVRRNAGLAAFVGALASGVAIAYLARAANTGAPLDWGLAAIMGVLGIAHLAAFVDARTPLLVADTQGVRIRLGNTWRGLPWGALSRVEHQPRRGPLRDGRLVLVVRHPARLIEELDSRGRRQSRLSEKLYGAPFAVPLALSTRVSGAGDDLTAALTALAGGEARIVVVQPEPEPQPEAEPESEVRTDPVAPEPEPTLPEEEQAEPRRRWRDPRPAIAHGIGVVAGLLTRRADDNDDADDQDLIVDEDPVVASATPSPLREPVTAQRAEVRRDGGMEEETDTEGGRELRRPGSVNLVEDTQVWGERVSPIARPGHAVEPLLVDDYVVEPAEDPVVGPQLVAARTRLGLTVDRLAERTRIRPHVIESIEVDDFAPCGGDFYARGHLRTLARVLGIDVTPLLTAYDERYADAPINPRRVFEAELATGTHGSIRGTRGGPNWSVLIAVVMALVLAWSVARLIMDSPVDLSGAAPVLNGSAGVHNTSSQPSAPVPVVITAAGGGARVLVRDATGELVFGGTLTFGETRKFQAVPPVRVQSSDGSVEIGIDGESRGALGATGERAQNTFTVG
ncbi:MAG TPA: helix-turn-helix domain-containing protein [Nocardioides sp.]|nr:helix-turn-helix domain-containing protein [Nocardioides sp.]